MKKLIKLLAPIMACMLLVTGAAAAETAKPSTHSLYVDGQQVNAGAYEILGNNYFKLRDLAQMLNGTAKQFEVTWSEADNAIGLISGQGYTAVGGELAAVGAANQTATLTDSVIYKDRTVANLTAYNVNHNNYFKLRDIGQTFDFYVGWNEAAQRIDIDTTKSYGDEDEEAPANAVHPRDQEYYDSGMPVLPGLKTPWEYQTGSDAEKERRTRIITGTVTGVVTFESTSDHIASGPAAGASLELWWRPTDTLIATATANENGEYTLTFDIRAWELSQAPLNRYGLAFDIRAYGVDSNGVKYSNVTSSGSQGIWTMLSFDSIGKYDTEASWQENIRIYHDAYYDIDFNFK